MIWFSDKEKEKVGEFCQDGFLDIISWWHGPRWIIDFANLASIIFLCLSDEFFYFKESCFFFILVWSSDVVYFPLSAKDAREFQEYNSIIFTTGISLSHRFYFVNTVLAIFRTHMMVCDSFHSSQACAAVQVLPWL